MIQQTATELAVAYDEISGCGVRVALTPTYTKMFVSFRFELADDPTLDYDDLHVYTTGLVHDLTLTQARRLHDALGTLLETSDA